VTPETTEVSPEKCRVQEDRPRFDSNALLFRCPTAVEAQEGSTSRKLPIL